LAVVLRDYLCRPCSSSFFLPLCESRNTLRQFSEGLIEASEIAAWPGSAWGRQAGRQARSGRQQKPERSKYGSGEFVNGKGGGDVPWKELKSNVQKLKGVLRAQVVGGGLTTPSKDGKRASSADSGGRIEW